MPPRVSTPSVLPLPVTRPTMYPTLKSFPAHGGLCPWAKTRPPDHRQRDALLSLAPGGCSGLDWSWFSSTLLSLTSESIESLFVLQLLRRLAWSDPTRSFLSPTTQLQRSQEYLDNDKVAIHGPVFEMTCLQIWAPRNIGKGNPFLSYSFQSCDWRWLEELLSRSKWTYYNSSFYW